jgi:aryl-alcohol dehydrogenase-like predicted oxidoreductase
MKKMDYVNLGKTDLKVSKISFGTIPILKGPFDIMTTYYNLTQKEAESLTQYAYENGINLFDTATNLAQLQHSCHQVPFDNCVTVMSLEQ